MGQEGDPRIPKWIMSQYAKQSPSDDSPDDSESSDSGDRDNKQPSRRGLRDNRMMNHRVEPKKKEDPKKGLGMGGMMRAFNSKSKFTGSWEEDLDTTIKIFNTMSNMCGLTEDEKVRSIPLMLDGDALSYFSSNHKDGDNYDQSIEMLRNWYNNEEKRSRILTKWQTMTLTQAMSDDPTSSEVAVFRKFMARLGSLQRQLDTHYQTDSFLRGAGQ